MSKPTDEERKQRMVAYEMTEIEQGNLSISDVAEENWDLLGKMVALEKVIVLREELIGKLEQENARLKGGFVADYRGAMIRSIHNRLLAANEHLTRLRIPSALACFRSALSIAQVAFDKLGKEHIK